MPNATATARRPVTLRTAIRRSIMTVFLVPGIVLALAGCATSVNKLSVNEMAGLRIQGVDIRYAPKASIRWGNARHDYLRQPNVQAEVKRISKQAEARADDFEQDEAGAQNKVMNSPEAQAYMRKRVNGLIKETLNKNVLPKYKGTRPVRLEVTIVGFVIPSAVARAVIGGTPMLAAVTTLKDAGNGVELAKLDKVSAAYAGSGLVGVLIDQAGSDLEHRVIAGYTKDVLDWLGKPAGG